MALQKVRRLPTGYDADYFRIDSVLFDIENRMIRIVLALYKDSGSRGRDEAPVARMQIDWTPPNLPFNLQDLNQAGNNPINLSYLALKQRVPVSNDDIDLRDAVDV